MPIEQVTARELPPVVSRPAESVPASSAPAASAAHSSVNTRVVAVSVSVCAAVFICLVIVVSFSLFFNITIVSRVVNLFLSFQKV